MKVSDALSIFAELINLVIFLYFTIVLIKINSLDIYGLFISAFGLLASLIADIASAVEEKT
ncbi:hypothetical protein HYW74_04795 [Candidatus Pacearchaeota archaeon]|nr:hypothetical protein [Candidatus Pacearchaeota archaeon]